MDARAIIAKLRMGAAPTAGELAWFAQGLADGSVSDAQAGAFAMGVCRCSLGVDGRTALTRAMRDTGDVLAWDLDGPVIDKHSTGGVGDCVSLLLAPALAECGAYVPMISGRGLGHTGGTLDKLEAIPGLGTAISDTQLKSIVAKIGCAIVGATARIAPADKRLYAIRDVTGTVESLDLITASILSKKLAASPEALVLDVKVGSGAFMKSQDDARNLARALVDTAEAAGCTTTAVLSDMSQPLAPALGNGLEVAEVMKVLTGQVDGALFKLTATLGGVLLVDAAVESDVQSAADKVAGVLRDGRAAERFGRMVAEQGGPLGFVDNWARFLPEPNVIRAVSALQDGIVQSIDGEALGLAVVRLGGGRQVETDAIDPSVGLCEMVRLGQTVVKGEPLAVIHAARQDVAEAAEKTVRSAIKLGSAPVTPPDLILDRID